MGTRWRGLLAPIDKPTGDGRRMAKGAFRHRPTPLALKWQRSDEAGHDTSVVIGTVETITIDEDAGEVWGEGVLFDDRPDLARLSEDVGEAILLTQQKVIGPSVDAGAATAILVETGSDEPISEERMEELFWESMESGVDPDIEVLFVDYEIAAATLVSIPAFVEARPFELLDPADDAASPALVAALTAAAPSYPAWAFADPGLAAYTELHVEERDGIEWVVGHFAPARGCHAQFRDACFTPPTSATDYALFHRTPIQLDTGELIAVGRITSGFGRVGTGCTCCPGKDDHACTELGLFDTIVHHDGLSALAYGRAGEDEHGLWFAGVVAPGLSEQGRRVLERRKFSGDWRDHGGNLELVELLGLAVGQPAFVAPRMALRSGRAFALTAAYPAPASAARQAATRPGGGLLQTMFARVLEDAIGPLRQAIDEAAGRVRHTRQVADAHAVTAAEGHTGAMIALRMTDADAARLAVEGGEPADELHITLAYLGDGTQIDDATRNQVVAAVRAAIDGAGPVEGNGFALSAFNPGDSEPETAIVLGVGGAGLTELHDRISDALGQMMDPDGECDPDEDGDCPPAAGFALPEQHSPWVPHITLAYSGDLGLIEQLTDRVGPVTFDRVRVAFAGATTDLPLAGEPPPPPLVDEAAALAGDALGALAADEADRLVRETEAMLAGRAVTV